MKKILPALLVAASLTACAGPSTMAPQGSSAEIRQEALRQQELVYKRYVEDQDHIYDVSFPLLSANAEFCGNATQPSIGITAWNIATVPTKYQAAAQSLYRLHDGLAIQSIATSSPAARAGLQSGDLILAIDGRQLPRGKQAIKAAADMMKAQGYNPYTIDIERQGKTMRKTVRPTAICAYPVLLDYDRSEINAYADGKRIVITKGILRFTENDNELALVIAHELAHSAMTHVDKLKQNAMAGTLGGLLIDGLFAAGGVGTGGQFAQIGADIGVQQYSVAFEQEADYVGMYFMERAGYNSAGVADFWRRMAAEGQSSITQRTSHPTSSERFIAIERTHQEIRSKKAKGMSLAPNMAR